MPTNKINRVQRKAAGMILMSLFAASNALSHALRQVAATNPPSGGGTGLGLTHKERKIINDLATRYHDNGEYIRIMGQRLVK